MGVNRNGGIWALGGYLYQTIGILGIGAVIYNLRGTGPLDEEGDLELLVQLVDVDKSENLQIHPEVFNEDALIHNYGFQRTDKGVFIQFKFSSQAQPPTIGPNEVEEIIDTFDESVSRANNNGINITACILITNRRFAQGEGSGGQAWDYKKKNPKRTYEIREIVEYTNNRSIENLRLFALRLGANHKQIEAGIRQLVGQVIIQAVEQFIPSSTFIEMLAEAFTGYPYTSPISVFDLKEKCKQQLNEFAHHIRIDAWDFLPIERDTFKDLFYRIHERALICICGKGGCGKSVLLWQLISSLDDSIYAVDVAPNIRTSWISYLINHVFRNIPLEFYNEPTDFALKRLLVANSGAKRPIFWLGLDGIDEVVNTDQKGMVRDILRWFWEKDKKGHTPDSVLITTSRSSQQLRNLLLLDYDYPGLEPLVFDLDQFNENELEQAFRRVFPNYIDLEPPTPFQRRLDTAIHTFQTGQEKHPLSLIKFEVPILRSLYHPVIWRSLLNLDSEAREGVMQGNKEALDELARDVILWFESKMNRRIPEINLRDERLIQLLKRIANESDSDQPIMNGEWLEHGRQVCGGNLANELFNEAERSGLIEFISENTWRWRHEFIYNYLANRQE